MKKTETNIVIGGTKLINILFTYPLVLTYVSLIIKFNIWLWWDLISMRR